MKIVLATMQFGRGYFQGTERYVRMLADGLTARGHQLVILAGDPQQRGVRRPLGTRIPDAHDVRHVPTRGWLAVRGLAPERLRAWLRAERPGLVHVANPAHIGVGLLEAARLERIPTVVTIMDYWWLCPKHTLHDTRRGVCAGNVPWRECLACIAAEGGGVAARLGRAPGGRALLLPIAYFGRAMLRGVGVDEIIRWTRRRQRLERALAQAAAVIFPSRTALELVGGAVRPDRRHAIPYGLEPRWFADVQTEPRQPSSAGSQRGLTIGYAGALAPHKGVHILLEAVRRLAWPDVRVLIAGVGDAEHERQLKAAAEGLPNIEFLGRVSSERMPAFLDGLDTLVIPSLWPENLPIAALEAYARRRTVIASGVGGVAEIVPAECLFEPGSVAGLMQRLAALRGGALGDETPAVSTAEAMVSRTLGVYNAAVDAPLADGAASEATSLPEETS
ncbi:MAG: glycosyltransferase [Phycisphaerae bacterium]|nr:glycosyltransferase [Phycisphaerae bacterium]MCZ2399145.1 glycosyltransferase [Phycisphaerae bacterium]